MSVCLNLWKKTKFYFRFPGFLYMYNESALPWTFRLFPESVKYDKKKANSYLQVYVVWCTEVKQCWYWSLFGVFIFFWCFPRILVGKGGSIDVNNNRLHIFYAWPQGKDWLDGHRMCQRVDSSTHSTNFFLRFSHIRVDLLSYESKPTDQQKQCDWRGEENVDGRDNTWIVSSLCIITVVLPQRSYKTLIFTTW